jgi:hypothetical protein
VGRGRPCAVNVRKLGRRKPSVGEPDAVDVFGAEGVTSAPLGPPLSRGYGTFRWDWSRK